MAGRGSRTTARARQMRRVLARWERSGRTLTEFARRHDIAASTLTWWRRVFRDAEGQPTARSTGKQRWGRHSRARQSREGAFSEVRLAAPARLAPAVWEIMLRSGHVLRVPAGADTDTLQRVLQAVHAAC